MPNESTTCRILFAVDNSSHSERAVQWYIDNVKNANDFVVLFHSVDLSGIVPSLTTSTTAHVADATIEADLKSRGVAVEKLKVKFETLLSSNGVQGKFAYATMFSNPGESVVWACGEHKIDHVIIGSRGMGTIRRTILGSVSDYVIHHANLPVTVVPPPKK